MPVWYQDEWEENESVFVNSFIQCLHVGRAKDKHDQRFCTVPKFTLFLTPLSPRFAA